jgi:hypothetical protein
MNGKKAKRIRREMYGDLSLRDKKYFWNAVGNIIRDPLRRAYRAAKKTRREA